MTWEFESNGIRIPSHLPSVATVQLLFPLSSPGIFVKYHKDERHYNQNPNAFTTYEMNDWHLDEAFEVTNV